MISNMEIAFKINQADINNQFETCDIALQSHEGPLNSSAFDNVSDIAKRQTVSKKCLIECSRQSAKKEQIALRAQRGDYQDLVDYVLRKTQTELSEKSA